MRKHKRGNDEHLLNQRPAAARGNTARLKKSEHNYDDTEYMISKSRRLVSFRIRFGPGSAITGDHS